jgi:hypothetical protein
VIDRHLAGRSGRRGCCSARVERTDLTGRAATSRGDPG